MGLMRPGFNRSCRQNQTINWTKLVANGSTIPKKETKSEKSADSFPPQIVRLSIKDWMHGVGMDRRIST